MLFDVRAVRRNGDIVLLQIEASDQQEVAGLVQQQGCAVLGVTPRYTMLRWSANRWVEKHRSNKFPLILFSQELLSLLDAGLSLMEALEALSEKEPRDDLRKTIDKIIALLYEGKTLSAALREISDIFPALYVATVHASEKTGNVSEALGRYVAYQQQLDTVRKKIIHASIYPAILLVVGSLVVLFLMVYVIPKFAAVYEGATSNLPFLSQLLLQWGELLQAHGGRVFTLIAALFCAVVYAASRDRVRAYVFRSLCRIPAIGTRIHIYQLARFYRTLAMLIKGGVPIVRGLEMVECLLQASVRVRLQQTLASLKEGRSVSQAMEAHELTTPVAVRMLRVGERAGNMGEMMERIAVFYDEDTARWVDWFSRLFEPLLMTLMGLVIGVIVVLMYLPVFELAGSLQ